MDLLGGTNKNKILNEQYEDDNLEEEMEEIKEKTGLSLEKALINAQKRFLEEVPNEVMSLLFNSLYNKEDLLSKEYFEFKRKKVIK